MSTPEEMLRQSAVDSKTKATAALDQGEAESKKAVAAAQTNIQAQQKAAVDRLLADAKTRGYTGGADTLQAEMVGGADRRVQSLEQGGGARGMDYANRRSMLGELYGKMEALAPTLGAQFAARLAAEAAAAAGKGRGGGGRGGGAGGSDYDFGGIPTTSQTDVLTSLVDRITADDTDQTTMDYERLFANMEGLSPRAQRYALEAWRQSGGSIGDMQSSLSRLGTKRPELLVAALGSRVGDGFRPQFGRPNRLAQAQVQKEAILRAIDDAQRNQNRVMSRTTARTQSTQSDRTSTRGRTSGRGFPFRLPS